MGNNTSMEREEGTWALVWELDPAKDTGIHE